MQKTVFPHLFFQGLLMFALLLQWLVQDAAASDDDFLRPQPGMLSESREHDSYLLLLQRKLLPTTTERVLASSIWFAGYRPATSVRITFDRVSGVFFVTGQEETESLWQSHQYWERYGGRELRGRSSKASGAPTKPQLLKIKSCRAELPPSLARQVVILMDTAVFNSRATEAKQMQKSESVYYFISTTIGDGMMESPLTGTPNGDIQSLLYRLNNVCWNGPSGMRLKALAKDSLSLAKTFQDELYQKTTRWDDLRNTGFSVEMTNYDRISHWIDPATN